MTDNYRVLAVGDEPSLTFAADELCRYLARLGGRACERTDAFDRAQIVLGGFDALAPWLGTPAPMSRWHDAVFVKTVAGRLFLSGPNGRSVLFSVYAYLEALGCRWLYPGPEGEHVPQAAVRLDGFDVFEKAAAMIRGAAAYPDCEGGSLYIDWMAKCRLNYFFSEFFLEARPGGRFGNPPMSEDELLHAAWKRGMLDAARKRGLIIERYGHGWSRGIVGRYAAEKGVTEAEADQALRAWRPGEAAEGNKPVKLNEFCLSHPDVKRILIGQICEFLDEHQDEQDVAAVWMDDNGEVCQCERCRTRPFSAWYMDIMRAVAMFAKKAAPDLRIECLVYMKTLPPPGFRPLDGLDNIIMILCPIRRCYRHSLFDDACRHVDWKPDFRDNPPRNTADLYYPINGDYLAAARAWQQCVDAPWYIFDYFNWIQMGWHKSFLGYLPDVIGADAAALQDHGFAGMAPCHYTQSFFPTNLTMWILARTLWDRRADIRTLRRDYLAAHFGPLARQAGEHMDAMRQAILKCAPYKTSPWQEQFAILKSIAADLAELRDGFDARCSADGLDETLRKRVFLLKADAVLQAGLYRAHYEYAAGNDAAGKAVSEELLAFLDQHRADLEWSLHFKSVRKLVERPDNFRNNQNWLRHNQDWDWMMG